LGANTFPNSTDTPEIDNIELLRNALKKENERQIAKYYEKILRIANSYRVDAREHYKLRDKLFAFLDELEKNDKTSFDGLQAQVSLVDTLAEQYQS
ncbi:MAG: hypothetical protein K2P35_01290, partial [Lachnospiraceae bacterium]|nr:hypothetical protein [Lachnospiraceae bacterium]